MATTALGPGVDPSASIGARTVIDRRASIGALARVGSGCTVEASVFVGRNVLIGRDCVIREGARIQESALIEDKITIGAGAAIANRVGKHVDGVTVRTGATIGAHARCVGPIVIGHWAVVEAGAVVITDVPDYAVVTGSPARRVGWSGRAGARLEAIGAHLWRCPRTGERYVDDDQTLTRVGPQKWAARG